MDINSIIGKRFGKLEVVGIDNERNEIELQRKINKEIKSNRKFCICKCDCGNMTSVGYSSLISGTTMSCGCIKKVKNTYEFLENDIVKGWDTKHENYFLVSKCDYDEVKKYCWQYRKDGYWMARKGNGDMTYIKLHQLIASLIDSEYKSSREIVPDHLDKNRYNNTRENIEIKTNCDNFKNKSFQKNNKSGVKGVSYHKASNGWTAYIGVNKKHYSKTFRTIEEAINQRLEWEKSLVLYM